MEVLIGIGGYAVIGIVWAVIWNSFLAVWIYRDEEEFILLNMLGWPISMMTYLVIGLSDLIRREK